MKLDEAIKYCEQDAGQKDVKDPADFDIDAFIKRFEDLEIAMEVILQAAKNWQTLVDARKDATAGEWLPIETAPRDDFPVDLWYEDQDGLFYYRVPDCRWSRAHEYWVNKEGLPADMKNYPTHWMPVPEPPTEKDTER